MAKLSRKDYIKPSSEGGNESVYRETLFYNQEAYDRGLSDHATAQLQAEQNPDVPMFTGVAATEKLKTFSTLLEKQRQDTINDIHDVITAPHASGDLTQEQTTAMEEWIARINSAEKTDGKYNMYRPESYEIPEALAGLYDDRAKEAISAGATKIEQQNNKIAQMDGTIRTATSSLADIVNTEGKSREDIQKECAAIVSGVTRELRTELITEAEVSRDSRTFTEEIEHDKTQLQKILKRPDDLLKAKTGQDVTDENRGTLVGQLSREDKKQYDLEKSTADVLKRTMHMAETAGVQITTGDGQSIDANANGLPLATYMMHGARFKFEIPAGSGHEVANYVLNGMTGDEARTTKPQNITGNQVSKSVDPEKAQRHDKAVFSRVIATHGAKIENGQVIETKGVGEGIKAIGRGDSHFGMNVAAGAYGEKDIHGRDMTLDGLSGHSYIYYRPPSATEPGCLMVGMEGCVPPTIQQAITGQAPEGQFDSHDVHGSADNFTTIGSRPAGAKFDGKTGRIESGQLDGRLENEKAVYAKQGVEHPYKDAVLPRRYDGTGVPLKNDMLNEVLSKSADEISTDIGNKVPKSTDKSQEQAVTTHVAKTDTVDKGALNKGCKQLEEKAAAEREDRIAAKKVEKQEKSLWNRFKNKVKAAAHWVGEKLGIIEPKAPEISAPIEGSFRKASQAELEEALLKDNVLAKAKEQAPKVGISDPVNVRHESGVGTRHDIEEALAAKKQQDIDSVVGKNPKEPSVPVEIPDTGIPFEGEDRRKMHGMRKTVDSGKMHPEDARDIGNSSKKIANDAASMDMRPAHEHEKGGTKGMSADKQASQKGIEVK